MVALFVITVVIFLTRRVAGVTAEEATGRREVGANVVLLLVIILLLGYIVWELILFARGTTPGKKLLGMRVIKDDGTSAGFFTMLIREWIGKLISGLFLGLGFLWILFDRDKQGWHDKLMSTYVVE